MTNLQSSSSAFLAASTNLVWDSAVWDDYVAQLDSWSLRPSELEFVPLEDDTVTQRQPAEVLLMLNKRTDITSPNASPTSVCNNLVDQVVESIDDCDVDIQNPGKPI